MKIFFDLVPRCPLSADQADGAIASFRVQLERDDSKEAISTNAGKKNIILTTNECRFFLPVNIFLPHPDLVAFCAMKIFSPYIGSKVRFDRPISSEFAEALKVAYPKIRKINTSSSQAPRRIATERPAVAFSGGLDSVTAAFLMPPGYPSHTNGPNPTSKTAGI